MKKKIKRTWWSKSRGEYITKEYEYEAIRRDGRITTRTRSDRRRSKLIIGKNGVYKKRLDELLNATTEPDIKAEIKAKVNEALREKQTLTTKSLLSRVAESKIERAFINAGYTEQEILDELNISRDDLFNEANWEGSKFTYDGASYLFQFTYTGSVLVKQ